LINSIVTIKTNQKSSNQVNQENQGSDINRTKFIGKEKDKESNYADHGVRKYDDEIGRFTSIDPLCFQVMR